jgi:hypothetical protein
MSFMRNINPTGAITDLRSVFREAGPARWRYAVLAAMCTFGIFGVMANQNWVGERRLPQITYINSWPADRTEAETKAFIAANQKKKDAREKAQAESEAAAQKLWMAVGRASGMDVDAIKQRAEADAAADKAKATALAAKNAALASAGAKSPATQTPVGH